MEVPLEEPQQEETELGFSIGLMFGVQGLSRMCDLILFSELKLLRLICRHWNFVIVNHRRFCTGHGKLGLGWEHKCDSFPLNSMTKFRTVTLKHFTVGLNRVFPLYWQQAAQLVKILKLDQLKVKCNELGQLINSCSALESLICDHIHFLGETVLQFTAEQLRNPNHSRQNWANLTNVPRYTVCCPHNDFSVLETVGRPTIKTIAIVKHNSFPLCLLDLFAKRSTGVLESFEFDKNNENAVQRNGVDGVSPSFEEMQGYIHQILAGSRQTLKTFHWTRNGPDEHLIRIFGQPNFGESLLSLAVAEKVARGWDPPRTAVFRTTLLNFIQARLFLVELNICIHLTREYRQDLIAVFPGMILLRKITLRVNSIERGHGGDVNIFENAPALIELTVIDKSIPKHHFNMHHHNQAQGVSSVYLAHLPQTIRKLTCEHFLQDQFAAALLHPSFVLVSKLEISPGLAITDNIMQLIITHVSQLRELCIKNAPRLTDAGLTGLDRNSCRELINCNSHSLLLSDLKPTQEVRRTLADLFYMEKLDFTGCGKLSDVSVCYAIRFPELTELVLSGCFNVSDIGLLSLGTHNPKLKSLSIRHNRRVSKLGLNRLIEIRKTIRCINTSHVVADRLSRSKICEIKEHPHYKDVVCFTPVRERNPWKD